MESTNNNNPNPSLSAQSQQHYGESNAYGNTASSNGAYQYLEASESKY